MSIIQQAKRELELINFGEDDTRVMIEILEKFFGQWDSGGAVWAVAPILQLCIAGIPLSPLRGTDDEWNHVGDDDDGPVLQNNRCSSVFKNGGGRAYDIDTAGCPTITFPYTPNSTEVRSPVLEVES